MASLPTCPQKTDLKHAIASNADFRHADISYSDLSAGDFKNSDFSDADLSDANLGHAYLVETKLDRARVQRADLFETVFEPSSFDGLIGIESANHLESLTYETSPNGLIELRKLLRDQGFREQERKITYALNRRQAEGNSTIERWFKLIAFDLTCRYGLNPGRCLRLIAFFWAMWALFFDFAIHKKGWMYFCCTRTLGTRVKSYQSRMWSKPSITKTGVKKVASWIAFEWRVLRASMLFSLVNAFSIGYKEFSIGQWLRMINKREYEIKPLGWTRPLAGIQSLLSVYLFALWLLAYFGRPFE